MHFSDQHTRIPDRVIVAVPVLPAYTHNPQYVGVLQWCDGPNVQAIKGEAESIMIHIQKKKVNSKEGEVYYFRALKHTLSLLDCTKKNGDAAVLKAFTDLCNHPTILMTIGQPFASELADAEATRAIIDIITESFNHLHEGDQQ